MMQITSQNIMDLINHSSEQDWKYKYIAYISVAEIMAYIKELTSIEKLISLILSDLNNPNVKIQYAFASRKYPQFIIQIFKTIITKK